MDKSKLFVGKTFGSYEEITNFVNEYEIHHHQKFWKRSSRKITSTANIKRYIRPELVYYELTYSCIHGGEKFKSRGRGLRKAATFRLETPCPAYIRLRASTKGDVLEIKGFSEEHNHNSVQEKWTIGQMDVLIEQYQKYPVLYDSHHEDYNNSELKNLYLSKIVESLQNVRLGVTEDDVISQWNTMIVRYVHAIKHQLQNLSKNSAALRSDTRWYLNKLEFLKSHLNSADFKLEDLEDASFSHEQEAGDRWASRDPLETSALVEIKEENNDIALPTKKSKKDGDVFFESDFSVARDENEIFGEFVASQLKKILNEEVRQDTVFEIHQVLHRALKKK